LLIAWNFAKYAIFRFFRLFIIFLTTLIFIKVSYPPFLFECWFHDKIADENVSAIINNGIIALTFKKATDGLWPTLFHQDFGNLA